MQIPSSQKHIILKPAVEWIIHSTEIHTHKTFILTHHHHPLFVWCRTKLASTGAANLFINPLKHVPGPVVASARTRFCSGSGVLCWGQPASMFPNKPHTHGDEYTVWSRAPQQPTTVSTGGLDPFLPPIPEKLLRCPGCTHTGVYLDPPPFSLSQGLATKWHHKL